MTKRSGSEPPRPGGEWVDFVLGHCEPEHRRRLEQRLREDPSAVAELEAVRRTIDESKKLTRHEPSPASRERALVAFRAWKATLEGKAAGEEARELGWLEIPGFLVAYVKYRIKTSPGFRALTLATVLHGILFCVIAGLTFVTLPRDRGIESIPLVNATPDRAVEEPAERISIDSILPKSDAWALAPAKPELRDVPRDSLDDSREIDEASTDPRGLWTELTNREDRLLIGRWILFARYGGERRDNLLRLFGGDAQTERAVERALAWLAERQADDGGWDVEVLGGDPRYRTGTSSLALLALLGGGHSTIQGEYREQVQRGIDWLIASRDERGWIGGTLDSEPTYLYNHVLASRVLLETYLMGLGSERLRDTASTAIATLVAAQNADGGWRHADPDHSTSDASVTSWALETLHLAQRSGAIAQDVPLETTIAAASTYLDSLTSDRGTVRYRADEPSEEVSISRIAGAYLAVDAFRARKEPLSAGGRARRDALVTLAADTDPSSLTTRVESFRLNDALFQIGNDAWRTWNARASRHLVETQLDDGSWAPQGPYAANGGAVAATAMGALSLEVYYRFPRRIGGS